jgi:hypothetical protein
MHKRILRKIKSEKPYSLEEAAAAAGQGSYRYNKKGLKPGELSLGEKEDLQKKQQEQQSSVEMLE